MLDDASDYKYMQPDAAQISGNIIPTADIRGEAPAMRIEDVYYLREMLYDFKQTISDAVTIRTITNQIDYNRLYSVGYEMAKYISAVRDSSERGLAKLSTMFPSEGIALRYGYSNILRFLFEDVATENPSYIYTCNVPSTIPFAPRTPFDNTDSLRLYYYYMAARRYDLFGFTGMPDMYLCTVVGGTFPYRGVRYYPSTSEIVDTTYTCAFVGDDNGIQYYVEEYQRHSHDLGSIFYLERTVPVSSSSGGGWEYKRINTFPTSDVYVEVSFDSSLDISSAFVGVRYDLPNSSTYPNRAVAIVPMTRTSGGNWQFKFYDMATVRELVEARGIAWERDGDWSTTKGDGCSIEVSIAVIFGLIENRYCALPSAWTWTPS